MNLKITLRYQGRLDSIGIGRTYVRIRVIVPVHDRNIRITTPPPASYSANSSST